MKKIELKNCSFCSNGKATHIVLFSKIDSMTKRFGKLDMDSASCIESIFLCKKCFSAARKEIKP